MIFLKDVFQTTDEIKQNEEKFKSAVEASFHQLDTLVRPYLSEAQNETLSEILERLVASVAEHSFQIGYSSAMQTFAEAAAGDSLTGKTIRLFNPEAGNEANRAAFEEAYGVKLPSTAAATWRMLREVAAQRSQQNAVENAGESVESSTETAADGAEPLSQRISADSRNPLALGSAENFTVLPKPPSLREVDASAASRRKEFYFTISASF
mgnify:CR=1 FL=1